MSARRRRRARSSGARRIALLLAAVAIFAGGIYLGRHLRRGPAGKPVSAPKPVVAESPRPAIPAGPPAEEPPTTAEPRPAARPARVALVIDDLGRSIEDLDRLAALGVPISYSVLPLEVLTPQVTARLRERGAEVLCHLPMEPGNGADPGPGALWSTMSREEMRSATAAALDAVPGAVGVNNHMGSVLSTHPEAMAWVGEVLGERGLFFLDSRTTPESVAYRVIRSLGVPAAERQVFLDPDLGEEAIREQFQRLVELARRDGAAIGIGHPHPSTFAVLEEGVPTALAAGVEFVPVSYLLERAQDPG